MMKVVRIFSLLLLVLLHGCDTGKEYADYDNQEEVTGFRETYNDKVLGELQAKKEELSKQIADKPEKEEDQAIDPKTLQLAHAMPTLVHPRV